MFHAGRISTDADGPHRRTAIFRNVQSTLLLFSPMYAISRISALNAPANGHEQMNE